MHKPNIYSWSNIFIFFSRTFPTSTYKAARAKRILQTTGIVPSMALYIYIYIYDTKHISG
jgi:hypothetical protein